MVTKFKNVFIYLLLSCLVRAPSLFFPYPPSDRLNSVIILSIVSLLTTPRMGNFHPPGCCSRSRLHPWVDVEPGASAEREDMSFWFWVTSFDMTFSSSSHLSVMSWFPDPLKLNRIPQCKCSICSLSIHYHLRTSRLLSFPSYWLDNCL